MSNNQYLLIIFKIKTDDKIYRTISTMQKIQKMDKDEIFLFLINIGALKSNNYLQFTTTEIHFNYKLIDNSLKIVSSKINRAEVLTYKPLSILRCGSFNFSSNYGFI